LILVTNTAYTDLFMYTIGEPSGPTADYLQWILSDDGQRVLLKRGYPPLRKL
jgi:ABC-type phosphate transport system substrate-binding protein